MAGRWRHTLQLADVWRDENREFTERRDEIVKRIKALPMFEADNHLQMLADDLQDAVEPWEFDDAWDYFYDWADDNDVWVAIF
jgi:hypothetical protein